MNKTNKATKRDAYSIYAYTRRMYKIAKDDLAQKKVDPVCSEYDWDKAEFIKNYAYLCYCNAKDVYAIAAQESQK